jgi:NTP pyrophosphatase (non-canonical NTP hydrolase)
MVNNMSKWFKQLQRPQVSTENLLKASEIIMTQIGKRLDQHGRGAYVSSHETLGFMQEEYKELVYAVQSNDDDAVSSELEDVAVVAIFGIASMLQAIQDNKAPVSPDNGQSAPKVEV